MAFDFKQLATSLGSGDTLGALGTTFGMPSCLLNLTSQMLALLPSPLLLFVSELSDEAAEKANEFIAELLRSVEDKLGILSFDTETGFLRFLSDTSLGSLNGLLAGIGGMVGAISAAAQAGAQLYLNVTQSIAQIQEIIDCLNSFLNGPGGPFASNLPPDYSSRYQQLAEAEYARIRAQLEEILKAIQAINALQERVNNEFQRRADDPFAEPMVASDPSGFGFTVMPMAQDREDVIRLVFGPPKSIEGQYLLSVDGLYYDSQTDDGLEPVLTYLRSKDMLIEASERWKFDHAPSLGGKGDQISNVSFNKWVNSIFDVKKVDDSIELKDHYAKDHFLRLLHGNKEKRVLDLSSYITQLTNDGASQAIIDNFKQSLISEVAYHEDKIRRRKKQIEIATKVNEVFGKSIQFAPGKVPINDFSYLEDCNISLSLSTQKGLVLRQDEVSGIVLPVRPTFAVSKSWEGADSELEFLSVPQIGVGAIITDSSGVSDASAAELSMSDVVTTSNLFAIYNYLNSKITSPSSSDYTVLNCMSTDDYNNAQLVGNSQEDIFRYGLASVYLEGITKNNGTSISGLGSYLRLPDTTEYQDWLYDPRGASFQTWTYVPDLSSNSSWFNNDASSLYRLVLSCENTGTHPNATNRTETINNIQLRYLSEYTRGLIVGFTRDTRWTKGTLPSNASEDNDASAAGFLIAPTISYDSTSIGFITKDCSYVDGWYGMFVPASATTSSGKALWKVSEEFCDLAFTLDYQKDEITLYLDKEVLAVSSVSQVFGSDTYRPPKLPSIIFTDSFEYNTSTVGPTAPDSLKTGPQLNDYFTPWILGGGYTDGMALTGNFMGGEFGGVTSGLRGYLGSTKFYRKPINGKEIEFNYLIQSKLYKNIAL
jgi:flagellin-specific chaperone FliS